jgi:topoisomerase IV subunit A
MGNIFSKNPIHKIQLKSKVYLSLEDNQFGLIWILTDSIQIQEVCILGDFMANDHILVVCKNGEYYTTNFDLSNRYQGDPSC